MVTWPTFRFVCFFVRKKKLSRSCVLLTMALVLFASNLPFQQSAAQSFSLFLSTLLNQPEKSRNGDDGEEIGVKIDVFADSHYCPRHHEDDSGLLVQPSAFHHSGPLLSSSRRSQQQWQYAATTSRRLAASNDDSNRLPEFDLPEDKEAEAERLRKKAEQLRRQIRDMETQLGSDRGRSNQVQPQQQETPPTKDTQQQQEPQETGMSLRNKRVLVAGANGRLGSMVCRYLLRQHPELREVVAAVHVVGENSSTARGYGRLAYEVGAEDGAGSIGPAWSSGEERTATFQYDGQVMAGYNLQKMRIVECELLDPVQCESILSDNDVDAVIWCATDFNGNTPRAVSGLNVAFLFRAVASPTKGRVEIEGLQNMLGAFKKAKQDRKWKSTTTTTTAAASTTTPRVNREAAVAAAAAA